jgi:hypothetical protein
MVVIEERERARERRKGRRKPSTHALCLNDRLLSSVYESLSIIYRIFACLFSFSFSFLNYFYHLALSLVLVFYVRISKRKWSNESCGE